jgi:transposase-like protein
MMNKVKNRVKKREVEGNVSDGPKNFFDATTAHLSQGEHIQTCIIHN